MADSGYCVTHPTLGGLQFYVPAADDELYRHYNQREDHYSSRGEMSQRHALGYGLYMYGLYMLIKGHHSRPCSTDY